MKKILRSETRVKYQHESGIGRKIMEGGQVASARKTEGENI
jgi:hypothetical protein